MITWVYGNGAAAIASSDNIMLYTITYVSDKMKGILHELFRGEICQLYKNPKPAMNVLFSLC